MKFKHETYEKLLDGRRVDWLAKKIGYTPNYLYMLFNNRITCRKAIAIAIVKTLNNDNEVSDYFDEI